MASISDILTVIQNGVVALNDLAMQAKGSLLGIKARMEFDTRALAAATSIPASVNFVFTAGFAVVGDLGGALYKKAGGSTLGGFQSADGQWWKLSENSPNANMFGAVGNGIADDTTAISSALTAQSATGGDVYLCGNGAKYKTSSTLTIPTGVILRGGGTGGAVIGLTSPTQVGTTISWAGAKGSAIVQFADLAHSCGIKDLRIDGNQISPDAASATGLLIQTNMGFQVQNITVENVGYAFYWQGTTASPFTNTCGPGSFTSNIKCENVFSALTFNGGTNGVNSAVTDMDIFGVFINNYVAYGINFVSGLDDIKIHGVYMQAQQVGSIGIIYNPANVLTTAAPGGTIIDSLTYASVAGAQFCVCNYTQGVDNLINAAFISGAGGTITPQRNSGGLLHVNVLGTFGIPNFDGGMIPIAGSTSGATTLQAQAAASGTLTLPSVTGVVLTDANTSITFAPTDQSGAGLSFSNVNFKYAIIANFVYLYGTLTYPATASGSTATISLPVAVPNHSYARVSAPIEVGIAGAYMITALANTSTARFELSGSGVANSTFSGIGMNFILIYPLT